MTDLRPVRVGVRLIPSPLLSRSQAAEVAELDRYAISGEARRAKKFSGFVMVYEGPPFHPRRRQL